MTLGFIGNFIPLHSTENDRKWSFEQLGHEVVIFQENQTRADDLINAIPHLDMLIYSHTHDPSYVINGLTEVFKQYKEAGVPTVSVHLDIWRGLQRWSDVGTEATWFVEHLFTPDNTGEWPIEINHHWLPPGVIDREAIQLPADRYKYPHDIVFVGSRGYHPEHPFRPQLIDWLENTYGEKFALYGNSGIRVVRGLDLNILYSSAKVVVGDSCFAGEIKGYWSDRIPETTGRNGFLLHPELKDCPHEGVVWYDKNNFNDLKSKIDYYLESDSEREALRDTGFKWTKDNMTYTHHSQTILDTIFGVRV